MYVPYQCCSQSFVDYYSNQAGNGPLPSYRGRIFQQGYGLGNFFSKLFRTAMPLLMSGAKTVGKEALRAGSLIATDVLAGEKLKTAAQNRAKETGKILARKAINKADEMIGRGKILKRKRKRSNRLSSVLERKKARRDIFDP